MPEGHVQFVMTSLAKNYKIYFPVIGWIAIDMMHG